MLIDSIRTGVPQPLVELITLGRTLAKRAVDVLAYFDRQAPATGPPRRSTAASSTCAAPPSDSATSPTTSLDPYSKPAASDSNYTLDCEGPPKGRLAQPLHRPARVKALRRRRPRARAAIFAAMAR